MVVPASLWDIFKVTPTTAVPQLPFVLPNMGPVLGVLLLIVFGCWIIFTLINFYHWFRYSRHSFVMLPALAVYLFVSMFLLVFAGVGSIL